MGKTKMKLISARNQQQKIAVCEGMVAQWVSAVSDGNDLWNE